MHPNVLKFDIMTTKYKYEVNVYFKAKLKPSQDYYLWKIVKTNSCILVLFTFTSCCPDLCLLVFFIHFNHQMSWHAYVNMMTKLL